MELAETVDNKLSPLGTRKVLSLLPKLISSVAPRVGCNVLPADNVVL